MRRLCLTGVSSLSQRLCHKCVSVMTNVSRTLTDLCVVCCLSLVTATVSLCLKDVTHTAQSPSAAGWPDDLNTTARTSSLFTTVPEVIASYVTVPEDCDKTVNGRSCKDMMDMACDCLPAGIMQRVPRDWMSAPSQISCLCLAGLLLLGSEARTTGQLVLSGFATYGSQKTINRAPCQNRGGVNEGRRPPRLFVSLWRD